MDLNFYHNFEIALTRLQTFAQQGIKDDLDRAGIIQGFEFTFEQCWKAIQKKGLTEGVTISSPKQAFTWAIETGWIDRLDEPLWRGMIENRNLTSHVYKESLAKTVSSIVLEVYVQAFTYLLNRMKTNN